VMMKRFGRAVTLGSKAPPRITGDTADGMDFDIFTGA